MIDLNTLRPILYAYRNQVQRAWTTTTAHPGFEAAPGDPAGQCGVTSAWLQHRLKTDHDIPTIYYTGRVYLHRELLADRHCWLQDGPVVIDLTGSQYGLNDVVCGHRLDLVPHYQGTPGRRPLKRLQLLMEAVS